MKIVMKYRPIIFVVMLSVTICSADVALSASNQHTLIKSLVSAKVSLQQGLTAAQRHGQPSQANLSSKTANSSYRVYIMNKEQFSELLVKAQSTALTKARITLRAAIDKGIRGSSGLRAVSVTPALKDGHAIASDVLLKGGEMKSVEQSLE